MPQQPPRWLPPLLAVVAGLVGRVPDLAAAEARPSEAEEALRVTFRAGSDCACVQRFRERLKSNGLAPRSLHAGEEGAELELEIRSSEPGLMVGTLWVRRGAIQGRRIVEARDCDSLLAALAFVAVVILDPERVGLPPSPPAPSPDMTGLVPQGPPWARLALGSGIEAASGLAPGVQGIVRAGLELEVARWRTSIRVSGGTGVRRQIGTSSGIAEIALAEARAEPCVGDVVAGDWAGRLCGVVNVLHLQGRGVHTVNPGEGGLWSVDLGVDLRSIWRVSRSFSVGGTLGVVFPLSSSQFFFSPNTTAYRTAPVAVLGELTTALYLW